MKIFGLCVTKNEADIIQDSINSFLEWGDIVSVVDNGSTDGSLEILQQMAQDNPKILVRSNYDQFEEHLRRVAFSAVAEQLNPGDWLCRLDSDEFYDVGVRSILKNMPPLHQVVFSTHYEYYYTDVDHAAYESLGKDYLKTPVTDRLHYYKKSIGEIRFFKFRKNLSWPLKHQWPTHIGIYAKTKVQVFHYQYRSPEQIKMRLQTRKPLYAKNAFWWHGEPEHWQHFICNSASCLDDRAELTSAKEVICEKHLEQRWRRIIKYIMHALRLWP